MSFYSKLLETYDNCITEVGVDHGDGKVLLPPFLTTQQAHLEVCITSEGEFLYGSTRVIEDKKEQTTIIPCYEKSANRASGLFAHPLFDKLKYIAGDGKQYFDDFKNGYEDYITKLQTLSEFMHLKPVSTLYEYLKKGRLLYDLVKDGIFPIAENGKIPVKKEKKEEAASLNERYPIYRMVANPKDAFVRFRVLPEKQGEDDRLWLNRELWHGFGDFILSRKDLKRGLCYVTGLDGIPIANMAPAKIRYSGDKAKLISSNDKDGLTYRGRFDKGGETFQIGYVQCEKIHNMLKWLIARQGSVNIDGQVFVAWGTNNEKIPDITVGLEDLGLAPLFTESQLDVRQDFSEKMRKALQGYAANLQNNSDVMILGLDAATLGRMSVTYYREMIGQDFIDRLTSWFSTCVWNLLYWDDQKKPHRYVGTPSLMDIVNCALGTKAEDKVKKAYRERLVPCILDGSRFPHDILGLIVTNASNPQTMSPGLYKKILGTACAVIRKVRNNEYKSAEEQKEEWKVGLDKSNTNRSYLFGRLLAYAMEIENYAMYASGEETRQTNAERMMHQFSLKPAKTWRILNEKLVSYYKRLGEQNAYWLRKEVNAIIAMIDVGFTDQKLDDVYLLGFASQMDEFENNKKNHKEKKDESISE